MNLVTNYAKKARAAGHMIQWTLTQKMVMREFLRKLEESTPTGSYLYLNVKVKAEENENGQVGRDDEEVYGEV